MSRFWLAVRSNWILVVIVAAGLLLRFWGIGYGLPYTYVADEPAYFSITLKMLQTGDLNPHWWYYPSLMFYLQAAALLVYFVVGRTLGLFASPADIPAPDMIAMGVGKLAMPSEFLVGRGLVALFSVACIVVVFVVGRRLHPNRWVALIAALLFAVSPTVVGSSARMGPDIFALFFALVAFFFALRMVDAPTLRHYVLAGAAAGLAVASKYNVGLVVLAIGTAHLLVFRSTAWRRKEIYIAALAAVVAFLVATPFAALDFQNFWEGVRWQATSYSAEGHAGQEGDALLWYLQYLWGAEGWVALFALAGAVLAVVRRNKREWVLLSYPLVYFALVSSLLVRNDRTILQIIPFLDLLAALCLVRVAERLVASQRLGKRATAIATAILVAILVILPLRGSIETDLFLTRVDDRETARVWLERNLPPGARVAVESYAPYLDTARWMVKGEYGLVDHSPEWYVQNGFEYLVFSYGAYGRYYEDAARYPKFAGDYDALFARFPEIARFDTLGYPIRVLKTNTDFFPAQRVAAHWGIYAPWLELAGYDWDAGNLTLYWRWLQPRREAFQLTTRLLDGDNREVAHSSGALAVASEGITRIPWDLAVSADVPPGVYRLELDLDAVGQGRVPVLSRTNAAVADKLYVGPLKIAPAAPSPAELVAAVRRDARFGAGIALWNYTAQVSDGRLALTLYWKSLAPVDRDYTIFIHLLDASGTVRAQVDAQPRKGAYPTSLWGAGEIVRDDYALQLPRDLLPGNYRVEIGWYEYPSLARLPVFDGAGNGLGDHLVLTEVSVP